MRLKSGGRISAKQKRDRGLLGLKLYEIGVFKAAPMDLRSYVLVIGIKKKVVQLYTLEPLSQK